MQPYYISVDIETTGKTPGNASIYELGACMVGQETKKFERKIHLLHKRSFDQETLTAMGIAEVAVLHARRRTVPPRRAMREFHKWVLRAANGKQPVFVANNAPFDWMFTAWYFEYFRIPNPFGYSALDMKAYFMGCMNSTWRDASLKRMAEAVGIPFATLPHRAVDDAVIQSKIFARLIALQKTPQE